MTPPPNYSEFSIRFMQVWNPIDRAHPTQCCPPNPPSDRSKPCHCSKPYHDSTDCADTGTWEPPQWWTDRPGPKLVFWGVVDRRLDTAWCLALAERCGTLVIFGPVQEIDPAIASHANIILPGPVPYEDLPGIARQADVLVMPYADLPVTRAIQPLKFKEYLTTGRPVVSRRLPAVASWHDAADLVDLEEELVEIASVRIQSGVPPEQKQARQRLAQESWVAKAAQFERLILSALERGNERAAVR